MVVFGATLVAAQAQKPEPNKPMKPAQVPVYSARTEITIKTETYVPEVYTYDQKPLPGQPVLVTPEQADAVVKKFKEAYPKLGSPRILVFVNRDLVDTQSGMRLTSRSEKINTTRKTTKSTLEQPPSGSPASVTIHAGRDVSLSGGGNAWEYPGKGKITSRTDNITTDNRYSQTDRKSSLTDRQTVRDVERLFGRPLRAGGASLADQNVATQLIANRPLKEMMANSEGEQARKDREALGKIADVVLEVLISSRNVVVPEVSGDKVYAAPDIQATAIRLSDSKILGQAASRDILGKDRYAGRTIRNFDVQEIAEATALALMDDMTLSAQ